MAIVAFHSQGGRNISIFPGDAWADAAIDDGSSSLLLFLAGLCSAWIILSLNNQKGYAQHETNNVMSCFAE